MSEITTGFALVIFSAVCGGMFALPIKLRRRYEIENLYVMAACVTMIVLPFVLAPFVLPHWRQAIAGAGTAVIWRGIGFGFAWGLGATTFGYAISMVGLSLGYAIIMGINTAAGSLLPFAVQSVGSLFRPSGIFIMTGVGGCILGVVICGIAGGLRTDKREDAEVVDAPGDISKSSSAMKRRQSTFVLGVLLCVVSGIMSASANLGFAFTSQVGTSAVRLGAPPSIAGLGSWMLVYWGGFTATGLWFGAQQLRKGTWRNNFGSGAVHDLGLAIAMGVLWFLAMIPYGVGAYYLGRLGTSVGWAISISASLIVANGLGFLSGEWKGSSARSRSVLFVGLAVLIAAMILLARGNSLAAFEKTPSETKAVTPGPVIKWRLAGCHVYQVTMHIS